MKKFTISNTRRIKIYLYVIYLILCFIPILNMGVSCNDDLNWRFFAQNSILSLAKQYYNAAIVQGRFLSMTQIFSLAIAFFHNDFLFRIIKFLILVFCIILVSEICQFLCGTLVKNLFLLMMPIFLQITIQHCPPDAFTTFVCIPFASLLLSVLFFIKKLNTNSNKYLIFSLLLYFFSLLSYEYFILLSPLFFIVSLKNSKFIDSLKNIKFHITIGFIYLLLYFVQRKLFPTNYLGNQVDLSRLGDSFKLLKMLILSGIPAIYYISPKGLNLIFYGGKLLSCSGVAYKIFAFIRIILTICLFYYLKVSTVKFSKQFVSKKQIVLGIVICSIFIVGLPFVNTITKAWLNYNDYKNIQATTISYILSIFVILVTILLYVLVSNHVLKSFIFYLFIIWSILVQIQNTSYSYLQNLSYKRILSIEKFFIENKDILRNRNIYSDDICSPFLMQAAPENYWNKYLTSHNLECRIKNDISQSNCILRHVFPEDYFIMGNKRMVENGIYCDNVTIFSKKKIDTLSLKYSNEKSEIVKLYSSQPVKKKTYYQYDIKSNTNEYIYIYDVSFEFYNKDIYKKDFLSIRGRYDDFWIENFISIRGRKPYNKLLIEFYNPDSNEETSNEMYSVYKNGNLILKDSIKKGYWEIEIDIPYDDFFEVYIETDYRRNISNGDNRHLSFLVTKIDFINEIGD